MTRWLSGVVAVVALLLAGCGDDDDDTAASETPASPAETETAGQSDEWSEIVDAATEEGTVTLYTTNTPDLIAALEAGFEAKYPGINFEYARGNAGELESKVNVERTSGAAGADVFSNTNNLYMQGLLDEGALSPPVGPSAELWQGNEFFLEETMATTAFGPFGLAWNTDLVEEPLVDYRDLLRPELKGRIGMIDLVSPTIIDFYAFLEENFGGEEFLVDLAAQEPKFFPSVVPQQQATVAGEIAATGFAVDSILGDKENGAPVEFVLPTPAKSSMAATGILEWAAHPNAAQVLFDYIISPEGQEAMMNSQPSDGYSALEEVSERDISELRGQDVARLTPEFITEYTAKWNRIFGR